MSHYGNEDPELEAFFKDQADGFADSGIYSAGDIYNTTSDFWGGKNALIEPEPAPIKNNLPAMWDLTIEQVQKDGRARDEFGFKKYGTRLQPFNGRDALADGFQEQLDGLVYLYQAIYERQFTQPVVEAAIKLVELFEQEQFLPTQAVELYDAVRKLKDIKGD